MGNQKVPMRAKLRAATDRTAKAVIQGMGFITVGVEVSRSAEETAKHDDNGRAYDGEADHR
jgi:hypothetical protein